MYFFIITYLIFQLNKEYMNILKKRKLQICIRERKLWILRKIMLLSHMQSEGSYGGFIESIFSIVKISFCSFTGNLFSRSNFITAFFLSSNVVWRIFTGAFVNNSGNSYDWFEQILIFFIAWPNMIFKLFCWQPCNNTTLQNNL